MKRPGFRTFAKLDCDRILQLELWRDQIWALTDKSGLNLWERVPASSGASA